MESALIYSNVSFTSVIVANQFWEVIIWCQSWYTYMAPEINSLSTDPVCSSINVNAVCSSDFTHVCNIFQNNELILDERRNSIRQIEMKQCRHAIGPWCPQRTQKNCGFGLLLGRNELIYISFLLSSFVYIFPGLRYDFLYHMVLHVAMISIQFGHFEKYYHAKACFISSLWYSVFWWIPDML